MRGHTGTLRPETQRGGPARNGTAPKTQSISTAEDSDTAPAEQARACEAMSRRYALLALALGGGAALQHAALAGHYARRAAALHEGLTK